MLTTSILGIPIINILYQQALLQRAVEQQERDGENANLVQEGNNDALEGNEENDARRGREDESEEERNVRPRRG